MNYNYSVMSTWSTGRRVKGTFVILLDLYGSLDIYLPMRRMKYNIKQHPQNSSAFVHIFKKKTLCSYPNITIFQKKEIK